MSKELKNCLEQKRHTSDFVFTNASDQKLTKRTISGHINRFKEHFGINEQWMYFDLRHSFAHHFLAKGGKLQDLKEKLGIRQLVSLRTVYVDRPVSQVAISSPFES